MIKHVDVIIVGGGLVGAGFAAALKHLPITIALIDAKLATAHDPRLLALNYHSCQFLKNIGLWPALEKFANPIQHIHVSRRAHFGAVRINCQDVGLSELGYIIPAAIIEQALLPMLQTPTITLYQPATLIDLQQTDDLATVTIKNADATQQLQAPMVIGADGTHSTVRTFANIAIKEFDYQQSAIVTQTSLTRLHGNIAYERFVDDGAIAMLPLAANETTSYRSATIWSAKDTTIAALMQLNDDDFLQRLQQVFGYRLGKLTHISKRFSYPLKMLQAVTNHKQCVFLLGNAAHTLHPIAAQGLNLSLYEVAVCIDAIKQQWKSSGDLTKTAFTKIISTAFSSQQTLSMGLSHRLSTYFSSDSRLVSFALQLGMLGLDRIHFAKRNFIHSMLGRTGSLPRLLLSTEDYENNIHR